MSVCPPMPVQRGLLLLAIVALLLGAMVPLAAPPPVGADAHIVPIGFIQGSVGDDDDGKAHRSQFAPASSFACSTQVFAIRGVVTQRIQTKTSRGAANYGFFIQNTAETADGDSKSSDGLFVFTRSATTIPSDDPDVSGPYSPVVGDEIVLQGQVAEFFNFTQFCSNSQLRLLDKVTDGRLDDTVVTEANPPDDLAEANRFWERHEGMRFSVPAGTQVVGGRSVFASTADAEVWVIPGDHPVAQREAAYTNRVFRDPHPLDNVPDEQFDDGNGYRIMLTSHGLKWLESDGDAMLAPARTFDTVTNGVTGSLYFSFGKYAIEAEQQIDLTTGSDPSQNAAPIDPIRAIEYSTAVYNVENLYDFRNDPHDGCDFAGDPGCPGVRAPFNYVPASDEAYQAQLAGLADQIATDLHGPDIILIQEAEDQDICTVTGDDLACDLSPDGTNGADHKPDTLQELALALGANHGLPYDAAYDRDGADDRGIVNGFLYRTDRVELHEADAAHAVLGSDPQITYAGAALDYNAHVQNPKALNATLPDGVALGDGCQATKEPTGRCVFTRDPQVAYFRVWRDGIGTSVFTDVYAISNHFSSNPQARVEQRTEQAAYNAAIVEALSGAMDGSRVIVGGDFNVFPRPDDPFTPQHGLSDQLAALYEVGLEDLWAVVAGDVPENAYSYVFEGQAQTLDNHFTTGVLADELRGVRFAHINADWPAEFDGDGSRGSSDHDPQVARFENRPTVPRLLDLVDYYIETGQIDSPRIGELIRSGLETAAEAVESGQGQSGERQLDELVAYLEGDEAGGLDAVAANALVVELGLLLGR